MWRQGEMETISCGWGGDRYVSSSLAIYDYPYSLTHPIYAVYGAEHNMILCFICCTYLILTN